jgi:hypothetical protein
MCRNLYHRIKISNRRATQRCNVSAFFYAKICSLLARRRSSQPVQRVYWSENVIDWLGKWRPTCVMRHARGHKLQSFRRKWPFYIDLYSMPILARGTASNYVFRATDQYRFRKSISSVFCRLVFVLHDRIFNVPRWVVTPHINTGLQLVALCKKNFFFQNMEISTQKNVFYTKKESINNHMHR